MNGRSQRSARSRHQVSSLSVSLTENFYAWEQRLRGWDVWPYPVALEPPYIPLYGQGLDIAPVVDDGRTETIFSRFASLFTGRSWDSPDNQYVSTQQNAYEADDEAWIPDLFVAEGGLCAFQIQLPESVEYATAHCRSFFRALSALKYPVSFEIIGCETYIALQFVCRERDELTLGSQLRAFFPQAVITQGEDVLLAVTRSSSDAYESGDTSDACMSIVDFGLAQEVVVPFVSAAESASDPLTSILGVLGMCNRGEFAALQVLIAPCRAPWARTLRESVIDDDGSSFFSDAPEFVKTVQEKTASTLYCGVVRAIGCGSSEASAHRHVVALGGALAQFGEQTTNALIPLNGDGYTNEIHAYDVLERTTHRTGMIMSSAELVSIVHLPRSTIGSRKLLRATERTKERPRVVSYYSKCCIGHNVHHGASEPVYLNDEQRLRHTYVVGASGTGKSTLLLHMMCEDIVAGRGIALLDPHGDLSEDLLARIPRERQKDVVFIDPSDSEYPVGLNIFQANTDAERTLIASDLPRLFERLSSSWGDQMHAVLANGILAMLAHKDGATLLTLRQFLLDARFRKEFLRGVSDVEVHHYWQHIFPTLSGRPYAPVLTRLDTFLRSEVIRHMVGQRASRIDYDKILSSGKILIAKLAHGAIGEENASLLGTLIVTAIHQAALRRERLSQSERSPFYLYIDEFQNFVTPTMEGLLSGARKYGVGLTLAHQELRQLASRDRDVASSVLSNPYTRICFRVGEQDAQSLARGYASFGSDDLQSLSIGKAIVRVEQAQYDFTMDTPRAPAALEGAHEVRDQIVEQVRSLYGTSRESVEEELRVFYASGRDEDVPDETEESNSVKGGVALSGDVSVGAATVEQKAKSAAKEKSRATQKKAPETEGRGGPSHVYLQSLIKKIAQERGFRAQTEFKVDGGFVDVALLGAKQNIAVEISVGTSQVYEVGNVTKCLKADFQIVLLISHDKRKLQAIERKVLDAVSEDVASKVRYLVPEELLAFLDECGAENASTEKTVRGYKVKVNYMAVDGKVQQRKREAIAKLMVESFKKG